MPTAPNIDTSAPHPARVYDYWLGGKDNFEADRQAAEAAMEIFPYTVQSARACRRYLARVVRFLAVEAGIRQFLDIGTGLPSADNVHEVAQAAAPDSRIVYVDNDPIVLVHARALLTSSPEGETHYIDADLRNTGAILDQAGQFLDFSQPVAVMLLAILHFITDEQDPAGIIRTLMEPLAPGSYLALGHHTADIYPELEGFAQYLSKLNPDYRATMRTRDQVAGFFGDLEPVPPGVVQLSQWRPDSSYDADLPAALWGGVARKR
ncbi:MAG: SAM-dependent methyltransferase [Actinobacteria bacterium]|nr:SAM-dependent methyltransferase [Actinomycetota bacterium]